MKGVITLTEKGQKIYSIVAKIFIAILVVAVLLFIYALAFDDDYIIASIVMVIIVCVLSLPSGLVIKLIYKDENENND